MKKVSKEVEIYGSPPSVHTPSIVANGHYAIAPEDNSSEGRFTPYNHFVVHNLSNSNIKVTVQDREFFVSAHTTREEHDIFFSVLDVLEVSGLEITEGDLQIEVNRAPMNADTKALNDAKKTLYGKNWGV
jgi:hypothetical protein